MGIFEHSTRLPVSHTISPLEFLSLIFTYYYTEPISFPKVMRVDCPHIVRLSADEDAHFKFSFGNKVGPLQKQQIYSRSKPPRTVSSRRFHVLIQLLSRFLHSQPQSAFQKCGLRSRCKFVLNSPEFTSWYAVDFAIPRITTISSTVQALFLGNFFSCDVLIILSSHFSRAV